MPSPKAVLCAALAAGALLGSSSAEARFGKHSSSQSNNNRGNDRPSRPSRPPRDEQPRTHQATPIGKEASNDNDDAPRRRRRAVVRRPLPELIVAGAIIAAPRPRAVALTRVRERHEPVPLMVRLGVEGGLLGDGGAMGLFMATEGRRLGVDTRITGISLPADDGSDEVDRITLMSAHLTAALWAGPRGRVRVEAGVATAHAPHIIFVGPSFGASAEACIGRSPVDLEARLHATPYPHRQVDVQAGLAAHLGSLNVRGGWRGLYLDDAGHVDGIQHTEGLAGPYLGLGFAF
ncbi:hypothetical protein [Pyxidicoccus sp. MSG2]|uniref:hypothetical protein n=1 Tax=Pyxidicoccus sp. MSG2 TaxID=2996790 RepID=UPI002270C915|nr:hypothetical protein [Pyxidicoccus sp. MSG2]MCY1018884.1 hypothetical protein [Pyxidicoccus sp. MSG2]